MNKLTTIIGFLDILAVTGCAASGTQAVVPEIGVILNNGPKVVSVQPVTNLGGIKNSLYEVVIQCRSGNELRMFFLLPQGKGPFPGVYFMHWLGDVKSDNTEFLQEADSLASKGIASVLPQGFFPWRKAQKGVPEDIQLVHDQVSDMAEALAYFRSRPEVDSARLVFVGHDYGAMHGILLESHTKAFIGCVLMAAVSSYLDWGSYFYVIAGPAEAKKYASVIEKTDPALFIGGLSVPLLFQFAERDQYITKEQALKLYNAAGSNKSVRWYDTGHYLDVPEASLDRDNWILKILTK